jgi:N-acetylmuramoyl-L-alanine amidase
MKKCISLLFVAALMLFVNVNWTSAAAKPASAAAGASVPKLYLDGKALEAKVPPALIHSSVLVPIRTVAEKLGYKVGWDTKKKQVSVKEGTTTILMTLNNPQATVNGKKVKMTEPPTLKSDTTLIPLRFVGETLGLQLLWDNASKSVFLYTDASSGKPGNNGGSGSTGATGNGTGSGTNNGTGSNTGVGSGAGTGAIPGTGSNTGSNPAGGGLIGVVDGNGGITDGTDGTSDSGDQSGNGGTTPVPVPVPAPTPEPVVNPAHLHQIRYEQNQVVITYEGSTSAVPLVITGPDRLVLDLPNADFAADFTADQTPSFPTAGQILELAVTGDEALQKIRFSQYETHPNKARVVLDLNQPWGYQITNDTTKGEIRVFLSKPLPETVVPTTPDKSQITVVLDAGHGGKDPGAPSVSGRHEKEFNLIMVKKVQALLASESRINLVLTRTSDTYPTLDDRVQLANSLKADLFLSIHANSYYKATNGTETYYTRAASLDFTKLLHKNVVAATRLKDNGVRTANYYVTKYTTMPAALLEVGYLSNPSDESQLFNEAFQDRVAAAVAASIKQYFKLS